MKCLQELKCYDCSSIDDECVKLLSEASSQIQHFAADLIWPRRFTDKALQYFAQSQIPLKGLTILDWKVTDNGIRQLGERGIEIESLILSGCFITDSILEIIAEKFPTLRLIYIIDCDKVTSNAIQKLRQNFIGKLKVESDYYQLSQSAIKSRWLK